MNLEDARIQQSTYHANDAVQEVIRQLDVVAVVGITQAGKSALINELMRLYPTDFHSVRSYTTRPKRPHETDDAMFFVSNIDQELTDISAGNYVQYTVHPTKGDLYGTKLDSYEQGKINLAPMLSSVIANLENIGFGTFRTLALIPEVDGWKHAFATAEFGPGEHIKRLEEAKNSLLWCLDHANDIVWFQKDYGDMTVNAQRLHDKLHEQPHSDQQAIDATHALLDTVILPLLQHPDAPYA